MAFLAGRKVVIPGLPFEVLTNFFPVFATPIICLGTNQIFYMFEKSSDMVHLVGTVH